MARKRFNVKGGVLSAGITNTATSFSSAALASFPAISGSDYAVIVLDPEGTPEIAHITAHTASATTATILRAQESTTGTAYSTGTQWRHVATVKDFEDELADGVKIVSTSGKLTIPSAAITATELATDAVTNIKIANLAVDTAELAAGAVTTAKIAASAVTSTELAANAVTSTKIASGAVTSSAIATDAVGAAAIAAGAVGASEIADGSVGSAELATGAVGNTQLASGAVDQAKIASGYRLTYSGTTAPSSPVEGDLWFQTDMDTLWYYDGGAWVAAGMKDWTSFTPSWTNVTVGSTGSTYGYYMKIGKMLHFKAGFVLGGTGVSIGGTISMAGPTGITPKTGFTNQVTCWGNAMIGSGNRYSSVGWVGTPGTTTWVGRIAGNGGAGYNATTPGTWAAGDELHLTGMIYID